MGWYILPSLSISNTLMASSGVRHRNSLAGSVCRRWRPEELCGLLRWMGLRNGRALITDILSISVPPINASSFGVSLSLFQTPPPAQSASSWKYIQNTYWIRLFVSLYIYMPRIWRDFRHLGCRHHYQVTKVGPCFFFQLAKANSSKAPACVHWSNNDREKDQNGF